MSALGIDVIDASQREPTLFVNGRFTDDATRGGVRFGRGRRHGHRSRACSSDATARGERGGRARGAHGRECGFREKVKKCRKSVFGTRVPKGRVRDAVCDHKRQKRSRDPMLYNFDRVVVVVVAMPAMTSSNASTNASTSAARCAALSVTRSRDAPSGTVGGRIAGT